MNSLLKRQIRKFLSEELKNNEDLAEFINAVDCLTIILMSSLYDSKSNGY